MSELNKPTIITIQNGFGRYEIEVPHTDVDLYEMLDLYRRLLLCAGYPVKEIVEENNEV